MLEEVCGMRSVLKVLGVVLVLFASVVFGGVFSVVPVVDAALGAPGQPSGPTSGDIFNEYTYTVDGVMSSDNMIFYQFDWGDGTGSDWLGPYGSFVPVSAKHVWTSYGRYDVRVRAKNFSSGVETAWSKPLKVYIDLLEVTGASGGMGVTVSVKNKGNVSKLVDYRVELVGGTFPGFHLNKIYDSSVDENDTLKPVLIKPGGTESVSVKPTMALGQFKINVIVWCDGYPYKVSRTFNALIFFFYVVIR